MSMEARDARKKFSLDSKTRRGTPEHVLRRAVKHEAVETGGRARTRSVSLDSEGLVLPRKLVNPCLQSNLLREVHKELKWNKKQ